jgi:glycosyltransferase involved in cell wall biosynthesis
MIGMLRVKNEARWIERAIGSILPLCSRVIVLDDHSEDETRTLCAKMPGVCVFESPFAGVDEVRDKNYLLEVASPDVDEGEWVVMLDGDEELAPGTSERLLFATGAGHRCLALQVLYLWDRPDQVRTDGIYSRFWQPRAFRFSRRDRFASASAAGFHCSNAPLGTWSSAGRVPGGALLHYGYLHRADRERKYEWYNRIDPGNAFEDGYRHMVIGDVFPADASFRHGGPLELRALAEFHG